MNLYVSWLNPRKARDITLVAEKPMLTFDDINITGPLPVYNEPVSDERTDPESIDSFGSFRMSVRDGDVTIPKVPGGEPLRNQCEYFLYCIESGEAPLTGVGEGIAVVKALEAMSRSINGGGKQEAV